MNGPFLKYLRAGLAAILFVALAALFLDFTETVPTGVHRLAHIQIVPAVLAGGAGLVVLVVWAVSALLFGRIYCSAVCPLGILQDMIARAVKPFRGKRGRYGFRPNMSNTRFAVALVFLLSLPFLPPFVSLLDPYSHFGRIMTSIFRPIVLAGNNLIAWGWGDGVGPVFTYRSIRVDMPAVVVAVAALLLVGTLAALFGRRYCNTICPVGTLLGWISRFSRYQIRLKADCISCGRCERSCKGECIDGKAKTVDASRCVACFNCLSSCRRGSLVYGPPLQAVSEPEPASRHQAACEPAVAGPTEARRGFLRWSLFSFLLPSLTAASGAARSSSPPPDPSLPTGVSRVEYRKTLPILPPGAGDRRRFQSKCTACHLCVAKCPDDIIRPSTTESGLAGFLQPVVKFDYGFCNYDCTICVQVCPTGALSGLKTREEKHRLQIGLVVFLKANCVVETQGSACGACAEHCPTGAVTMIPYGPPEKKLTIPKIDSGLCIGCGACEHICPVRPYRAIYVNGVERQGQAEPAYDPNAKRQEIPLDDFGF